MHSNAYPGNNSILPLPTCKGLVMLPVDSIIRIEAISNYSKLYFANGKSLVVAKVLVWFEKQLVGQGFLRPHRTHLVNRIYISSYVNGNGGCINLHNGDMIEVSKRKKTGFLQCLRMAA
jgi:two-component system, LytTR family, response regulator